VVKDVLRQTQPFGDEQRVGTAGDTDGEVIGRAQGLKVKFHAGVYHARCGVRQGLKFGVMRGDEAGNTFFHQVQQDGARQGRAFLRVGAGAKFVQQHQRFGARAFKDAHDVGDMPGESGEGLLDGLLIADISKYVVKEAQLGTRLRGDVQPGLRHHHHQPHCFQGHGLAAGIGTGDDQGEGSRVKVNIDGYHALRVQEGMAGIVEFYSRAGVAAITRRGDRAQDGFAGVQIFGVLGAHQAVVEARQGGDDVVDGFGFSANAA